MNQSMDNGSSQPKATAIKSIRLRQDEQTFWVMPPDDQQESFQPFVLPPLPMSHSNRCTSIAHLFHQETGRCMGFLLLLNVKTQTWWVGIPRQRCSKDAACWDAVRDDFVDLPADFLLAGSFQSRVFTSPKELPDVPPPHDGVHLVLRIKPNQGSVWSLLRIGDRCQPLHPDLLLLDDLQMSLDQSKSRLMLT